MTIRDVLRAVADAVFGAAFIFLAVWAFVGLAAYVQEWLS